MTMRMPFPRRDARGQSMLEAIVASGIIVTAVSSALTLVSNSINAEKDSEALIVAGNLAREGLEVVRGIRDGNWLSGDEFDAGMAGPDEDHVAAPVFDPESNAWSLDFTPTLVTDQSARVHRRLATVGKAVEGLYVQASSPPDGTVATPWSRVVEMDPVCEDGAGTRTIAASGSGCGALRKVGVRAVSRVRWSVAGRPKRIEMEEWLMDWR